MKKPKVPKVLPKLKRKPTPSLYAIREAELAELRDQYGSRTYGWNGTVHASELLNIQLGPDGKPIAVWFRCQMLPFDVSHVNQPRGVENQSLPRIMAVEVIDR